MKMFLVTNYENLLFSMVAALHCPCENFGAVGGGPVWDSEECLRTFFRCLKRLPFSALRRVVLLLTAG